ncbi:MAG: SlyX family protein [Kofleriaceae bacterium]
MSADPKDPLEDSDRERVMDLEVRLAYQDRQVRELDALVRLFGERLDQAERELRQLKQALVSPEAPQGPGNERPPHY